MKNNDGRICEPYLTNLRKKTLQIKDLKRLLYVFSNSFALNYVSPLVLNKSILFLTKEVLF